MDNAHQQQLRLVDRLVDSADQQDVLKSLSVISQLAPGWIDVAPRDAHMLTTTSLTKAEAWLQEQGLGAEEPFPSSGERARGATAASDVGQSTSPAPPPSPADGLTSTANPFASSAHNGRVIVSNLPPSIKEAGLRACIEDSVEGLLALKVSLPTAHRTPSAVAIFSSFAQARDAVSRLTGYPISGYSILLQLDDPLPATTPTAPRGMRHHSTPPLVDRPDARGYRLIVKHLPPTITSRQVEEAVLSCAPEAREFALVRPRHGGAPFAFCTVGSHESLRLVIRLLDGDSIGGARVRVEPELQRRGGDSPPRVLVGPRDRRGRSRSRSPERRKRGDGDGTEESSRHEHRREKRRRSRDRSRSRSTTHRHSSHSSSSKISRSKRSTDKDPAFDPTFFSLGLSATDCLLYTPKALQTISESMLPYTTPPTPTFERVVGLKLALGFLSSSAASKLLDNLSIPTKSCGDFLKAQAGRSTSYYSQQFTAILAHNLQVERFVQTAENIARTIKPSEEKTDWKGEYELRRTRKNWVSLGGEVVKKLQTIEFVTRVKVAFGEEVKLAPGGSSDRTASLESTSLALAPQLSTPSFSATLTLRELVLELAKHSAARFSLEEIALLGRQLEAVAALPTLDRTIEVHVALGWVTPEVARKALMAQTQFFDLEEQLCFEDWLLAQSGDDKGWFVRCLEKVSSRNAVNREAATMSQELAKALKR